MVRHTLAAVHSNAKPRRPNPPASAQAARWWPRTSKRRPHRQLEKMEEGEAGDDGGARPETVTSRTATTHWLGNKRKRHHAVGCLVFATLPAPWRSAVVGPVSRRGVSSRRLLLPAAIRGLACQSAGPPDQEPQDADFQPNLSKTRREFNAHQLFTCRYRSCDESCNVWGETTPLVHVEPNWPNTWRLLSELHFEGPDIVVKMGG